MKSVPPSQFIRDTVVKQTHVPQIVPSISARASKFPVNPETSTFTQFITKTTPPRVTKRAFTPLSLLRIFRKIFITFMVLVNRIFSATSDPLVDLFYDGGSRITPF